MNYFKKLICSLLSIALVGLSLNHANAALVTNAEVINHAQANDARSSVLQAVQRSDVKAQLRAMGVNPADIESRVNMMTAEEIALLNKHMDELPVGGDVLGVILIIFIVFVITDVIGATDIFPFIKPVN
ncbi:MAG: PA2779 family protein [Gammaproteobacteria bacterium]|nr:PA2779 family protein [Gammaproteobacteria bacterium]NNL06722.1 PA2779 family protein [Gammaproteobacteria bacterium]